MKQELNCVFCQILRRQIPASVIAENEGAIAILDISPLTLGHILVLPRSHATKIQDATTSEVAMVFQLVQELASAVESELDGVDGSLIAVHNGKSAGQEVPHLHVHVIPRRPDDGGAPVHTIFKEKRKFNKSEMDSIVKRISSSLKKQSSG